MDSTSSDHDSTSCASGIVYILTNPAMPGYVKIGKTINLIQRLARLNSEAVPAPFSCVYAAKVRDRHKVEYVLHSMFDDRRTTYDREFFLLDPDDAKQALRLMSHEDVTASVAPIAPLAPVISTKRPRVFMTAHMNPLTVTSDEDRIIEALAAHGGSFRSQNELGRALQITKSEVSKMLRNCSASRVERVWDPVTKCVVVQLKTLS